MNFLSVKFMNIFVSFLFDLNIFMSCIMSRLFTFMFCNFLSINCQLMWFSVFNVVWIFMVLVIFLDDSVMFDSAMSFSLLGWVRRRLVLLVFFSVLRLGVRIGYGLVFLFWLFILFMFLSEK